MAKKKKKVIDNFELFLENLNFQLPEEGSRCRVDEVGSLENGEQPADNGHLTRYLLMSMTLSLSLCLSLSFSLIVKGDCSRL